MSVSLGMVSKPGFGVFRGLMAWWLDVDGKPIQGRRLRTWENPFPLATTLPEWDPNINGRNTKWLFWSWRGLVSTPPDQLFLVFLSCRLFGTVHQSSNPPMVVTPNFRIVLGFGHVPKSAVLACSLFKLDAKVPNCCPSGLFILTPSWELAWLLGLPKLQSICCFSKSTCRLGYAHILSYNKQTYIYIFPGELDFFQFPAGLCGYHPNADRKSLTSNEASHVWPKGCPPNV